MVVTASVFYVYKHVTLDTNEVFYVGKGKGKRAYSKARSKFWKNIADKYGYKVLFIKKGLTEKEAFELEEKKIGNYKKRGLCRANLTDGGEGMAGYKFTEKQLGTLRKAVNKKEHREKKAKATKKRWECVDYQKKMKRMTEKLWLDTKFREKQRDGSRKIWGNPDLRKKHADALKEFMSTSDYNEYKVKLSKASKKMWESSEFRKKRKDSLEKVMATSEYKVKKSEGCKKMWKNSELRNKHRASMIKVTGAKEYRNKQAIVKGGKPFFILTLEGEVVEAFVSIKECARTYELHASHISECLHGKAKQHKGYTFRYKEE